MSPVLALQMGIPLARRPFEELARELDCSEAELLDVAGRSLREGTARRFGAVFDARRIGFRTALCCATLDDPDSAAALLTPHREVTHCYLREAPGCPNLWWTWSAPAERFDISLASIPFPFRTMPATRRYKIDVVFGGATRTADESTEDSLPPPDERERIIISALQGETEPRPDYFAAIAEKIGMKEWDLLSTLEIWRRKGRLRRIGLLLNHRRSGYAANGMCCFMVEGDTTAAGRALAELDCVTHCYERPPCAEFPYNLFAMVHCKTVDEAQARFFSLSDRLAAAGVAPKAKVMLISTKEYKKVSPRFYEGLRRKLSVVLGLAATMAFCAYAGPADPPSSVSAFGKAKVTRSAEGVDVESAVGAPWSGARFNYKKPVDISRLSCAMVSVTNLSPHQLTLVVSVTDGENKRKVCRDECILKPYGSSDFACSVLRKTRDVPVVLEGMAGYGKSDREVAIAPTNITAISVFRRCVDVKAKFRVTSIRFVGCAQTISGTPPDAASFFPFCDRFGQYRHADWPGKIHSESDFAANRAAESEWLKVHAESPIRGADRFGGWADGPQLKATGLFRVEKVEGRWWLVDPDGHLFFSHGIAGVRSGDGSNVNGRRNYFEWLPDGAAGNVSFQTVNLVRKYGEDPDRAIERDVMLRRLRAWGMNTIGNWSSSNIWTGAKFPYTDHISTKARPIKGLKLAGTKMPDVFAPEFGRNLAGTAAKIAERSGRDPWCIGWFVDNELSWGVHADGLARAILEAPEDQPARIAFVDRLAAEGKTVKEALASEKMLASLTEFFAERYFRSVRDAVAAVAPGRLYLGCRFCSSRVNKVVMDVAAKYCDVISANMYCMKPTRRAMIAKWGVDKPHMIGEFHFGALDRGMMHASLIPSRDQDDRAAKYRDYMKDALGSSMIVGAHWFLLRDQPLTGRRDGECFQCGFIDVADTPYRELVEAARSVAAGLYCAERGD